MARRSGGTYCGFRSLDADQGVWANHETYRHGKTWCGEERLFTEKQRAEPLRLVTCPKCSAAIGKAKLAKLGRVRLERMEKPISYQRSTYRVFVDDVECGLIGIDNGWGTRWNLMRIGKPDAWNGHSGRVANDPPNRWDAERWPTEGEHAHKYKAWPVHYASKEAMAVAALDFRDSGQLPTLEEQAEREAADKARREEEAAERKAMRARLATEREEREALRLERLAIWRDALASLDARADLSNVERAGLEAIKLLYPVT